MNTNQFTTILIIVLLLFIHHPFQASAHESDPWWNDLWSYREEIILPEKIDFGLVTFQPIDITIRFDHSCWAQNETAHSIRVIRQNGNQFQELESQIYSYDHIDEATIQNCNIVFLLPEGTKESDSFYVYYDETQTPQTTYIDHVHITDSSYYYEPISGFPLSSTFYHIIEDDISLYAISQKGRFMDYHTAQSITSLSPGTTTVSPKSGQAVASFDYSFFYGDKLDESHTTSQHLVSKHINVDGNLMVSCTIKSTSDTFDMFSTVHYRYYYCPGEEKRIYVHVTHEINNSYMVSDNVLTDGIYTTLFMSSVKSTAFKELNFGRIPGYIHFINEQKQFKEYPLDPNPPFISTGECIPVIRTSHDQDLSENDGWICVDDGRTGETHAVVYNTTKVIRSGDDERDGIQIKAYELDSPHLPGLENNMAVILLGRNSYEKGDELDIHTPKDFVVSFQAMFFSTSTGSYQQVIKEAEVYRILKDLRNQKNEGYQTDKKQAPSYTMTIFVHNTHTLPYAQIFNLATGLNLPYIQVEIYRDNQLIRSATPSRIHIHSSGELTDSNNAKLPRLLRIVDWNHSSFFNSVVFTDLIEDDYILKVFRYRPFSYDSPQFIGVKAIHLDGSFKTHIICTRQGTIEIGVIDQHGQPMPTVDIQILSETHPISMNSTDIQGRTRLHVPIDPNLSPTIQVLYKGILITNETIRSHNLLGLRPFNREITIERYDLTLAFKDTWGIVPAITLYPSLKSTRQIHPYSFQVEEISPGTYIYHDLPKASYLLVPHTSIDEEYVELDTHTHKTYIIKDAYDVYYTLYGRRGMQIENIEATIKREGIYCVNQLTESIGIITLPPGVYSLVLKDGEDIIGSRNIQVYSDTYIDLVTIVEPLDLPSIIFILFLIILISGALMVKKQSIGYLIIGLIVCLVLLVSTTPWWMIQGHTNNLDVRTTLYCIPSTLITIYTNETICTGELAGLPSILPPVLIFFFALVLIGSIAQILLEYKRCSEKYIIPKQSLLLLVIPIIITIGFIGATSSLYLLSDVTTGGFMGKGSIIATVPGDTTSHMIQSIWGPDIGWYAMLGITIIVWISILSTYHKKRRTMSQV